MSSFAYKQAASSQQAPDVDYYFSQVQSQLELIRNYLAKSDRWEVQELEKNLSDLEDEVSSAQNLVATLGEGIEALQDHIDTLDSVLAERS